MFLGVFFRQCAIPTYFSFSNLFILMIQSTSRWVKFVKTHWKNIKNIKNILIKPMFVRTFFKIFRNYKYMFLKIDRERINKRIFLNWVTSGTTFLSCFYTFLISPLIRVSCLAIYNSNNQLLPSSLPCCCVAPILLILSDNILAAFAHLFVVPLWQFWSDASVRLPYSILNSVMIVQWVFAIRNTTLQ